MVILQLMHGGLIMTSEDGNRDMSDLSVSSVDLLFTLLEKIGARRYTDAGSFMTRVNIYRICKDFEQFVEQYPEKDNDLAMQDWIMLSSMHEGHIADSMMKAISVI
jgi:hypothetical protein